jgi:hypothetical protein
MGRILGNVALDRLKLLGGLNQMVEALLLPKTSARLQQLIDFLRRESLPGRALSFDFRFAQQADNGMDVIGHHHKVAHVVAISIEVQQSIRDDLAQFRTPQNARSQPFVERFQVLPRKRLVKLAPERDIQPVKLVPPVSISH